MKRVGKILKILFWVTVVALVIGFGIWSVSRHPQQKLPISPEQALKNTDGNVITGPNGEMFFEYSGLPGSALEKPDEGTDNVAYYLSGVWRWNDKLSAYPGMKLNTKQVVSLKFNSVRASESGLLFQQYDDEEEFSLGYVGREPGHGYGYLCGWMDITSQVVDLGEEPQKVSKELYEYFLENATPSSKETYLAAVDQYLWEAKIKTEEYTVSGYWRWNDALVFVTSAKHTEMKLAGIFGDGQPFCRLAFTRLGRSHSLVLMYSTVENAFPDCECWNDSRGGWSDESMQYIYLGEDPQTVSGDEYYWFIANATPCTKEEYEAMAERYSRAEQ